MTRERAKELLPLIEAFANGKNIQYRDSQGWHDTESPCFAFDVEYRVKPDEAI